MVTPRVLLLEGLGRNYILDWIPSCRSDWFAFRFTVSKIHMYLFVTRILIGSVDGKQVLALRSFWTFRHPLGTWPEHTFGFELAQASPV